MEEKNYEKRIYDLKSELFAEIRNLVPVGGCFNFNLPPVEAYKAVDNELKEVKIYSVSVTDADDSELIFSSENTNDGEDEPYKYTLESILEILERIKFDRKHIAINKFKDLVQKYGNLKLSDVIKMRDSNNEKVRIEIDNEFYTLNEICISGGLLRIECEKDGQGFSFLPERFQTEELKEIVRIYGESFVNPAELVRLNETQFSIIQKFKDVIKEMKENKIGIVYERDESEFCFFNKERMESCSVEYGKEDSIYLGNHKYYIVTNLLYRDESFKDIQTTYYYRCDQENVYVSFK